jgi:hypothetical protein
VADELLVCRFGPLKAEFERLVADPDLEDGAFPLVSPAQHADAATADDTTPTSSQLDPSPAVTVCTHGSSPHATPCDSFIEQSVIVTRRTHSPRVVHAARCSVESCGRSSSARVASGESCRPHRGVVNRSSDWTSSRSTLAGTPYPAHAKFHSVRDAVGLIVCGMHI